MDTTIYNSARRDIKLNDIPHQSNTGGYKFSQGQLSVLNQGNFQQLSVLNVQIEQQYNKARDLRKEIIAFQSITDKMITEGEKEKNSYTDEIEAENDNLKMVKADRRQYLEDMMIRGYVPRDNKNSQPEVKIAETKLKNKRINGKEILSFLLSWGSGEVFMTYVQYKSLRYEKDLESIIARSIVFALVLFLIHFVAHLNRSRRRMIYSLFLVFSFLMVFFMLFGPLILNQLYPESKGVALVQQWSIGGADKVSAGQHVSSYPFWVELYRKNDMIPGILSFFFFLIMISFIKREKKQLNDIIPAEPVISPATGQDEIANKIAYYDAEIRRIDGRVTELRNAQSRSLNPTTESLGAIYIELKGKQAMELSHIEERNQLIAARRILLNEVVSQLANYQLEFMEALNNDSFKNNLVRPDWPTENDIINYYKINV